MGEMASLVAQLVKSPPAMQEAQFDSWVGKIPWRRGRLPTPVFLVFPGGSDSKESTFNVGDLGSIPRLRRSPGGRHGNPLQDSCLENPHGQRSLAAYSPWGHRESNMTKHSTSWASLVAQMVKNPPAMWETWVRSLIGKIPWKRAWQPTPVFLPGESPWAEEPGRVQFMGSQRVGHD